MLPGQAAEGDVKGLSTSAARWQDKLPTVAKELVAGGVSGGVAKTCVAPLERLKILFQTQQGNFQAAGIWKSLETILRTEGIRGLYRGNSASVARVVPYAALHLMTYEQYRRWLTAGTPVATHSPLADLAAGSLAGATAVACTYPLDLIRTRLAFQTGPVNKEGHVAFRGVADAFCGILRQAGIRGLYRGVGPTLWGVLPYAGLKFYIYEALKKRLPGDGPPTIVAKLTCGAISGAVGQTVTYPLDVVRRQMQVQSAIPGKLSPGGGGRLPISSSLSYRGTLDGLKTVVRTQGWQQLYAGISINYLKMVPSVAIGFAVYDGMKAWLRVPPRHAGH